MRRRTRNGEVLRIKDSVRQRDGYRCTKCGMTASEHKKTYRKKLDVHRLTPGSLYTLEGCITLCQSCHSKEPGRPRGTVDLEDPNPKATTVMIPADLVRTTRIVCALQSLGSKRAVRATEYIDAVLRPRVLKDYKDLMGEEEA